MSMSKRTAPPKKKRAKNFSSDETDTLRSIIESNSTLLEIIRHKSSGLKEEKEKAWKLVYVKFREQHPHTDFTIKCLKNRFKNISGRFGSSSVGAYSSDLSISPALFEQKMETGSPGSSPPGCSPPYFAASSSLDHSPVHLHSDSDSWHTFPSPTQACWRIFCEFEDMMFLRGLQSFSDFLQNWNLRLESAVRTGLSYPDNILAYKLLKQACLEEDTRNSILDAIENHEEKHEANLLQQIIEMLRFLFDEKDSLEDKINPLETSLFKYSPPEHERMCPTNHQLKSSQELPINHLQEEPRSYSHLDPLKSSLNCPLKSSPVEQITSHKMEPIQCLSVEIKRSRPDETVKSATDAEIQSHDEPIKPPTEKAKKIVSEELIHDSSEGPNNSSLEQEELEMFPPPSHQPIIKKENTKDIMDLKDNLESLANSPFGSGSRLEVDDGAGSSNNLIKRKSNRTTEIDGAKKEALECTACNKTFATGKERRKHIRSDHRIYCELCFKECADEGALKTHLHLHEEMKYLCDKCDSRFPTEKRLEAHGKEHLIYKCDQCGKDFVGITRFNGHNKYHLGFKCTTCLRSFLSQEGLDEHVSKHKLFRCEECDINFFYKGKYNAHMKFSVKHAPAVRTRDYKCDICDKTYFERNKLKKHKLRHDPPKFECPVCCKKMFYEFDYKRHLSIHSGEKPYECEVCLRRFTQKSDRNKHRQLHERDSFENTT